MTQSPVRLRLSEVLNELGWTQKKLAEEAGISRQAVVNLMKGPDSIRLETLDRISQATGKPVSDLLVQEE